MGGAFDGHEKGDIAIILSPRNIAAMKEVGLYPVSYRLRTELGGEVWHWNPRGVWSEGNKHQGYWVSDTAVTNPIEVSNGYRLPRRGNTRDQANNDGYSRIDDGDTNTFWKSNPYLGQYYTKEPNKLHPQWVIADFGKLQYVNAVRIKWGNPFPSSYEIDGAPDTGSGYFDPLQPGLWKPIADHIANGNSGDKLVIFSKKPVRVRFIRIMMVNSSYTGPPVGDIRDRSGFAIREMEAGLVDEKGKFHDYIRHAPDNEKQTDIYVSSTDPWHRAADRDTDTEQAGIDRFFTCGLTGGQPVLMPAGLLYDTPENMVNLFKYLKAEKYPVKEIEMGEEPDGQRVSPEDYAALYYQFGMKLRQVMPSVRMGGPGFATLSFNQEDDHSFPEAAWTGRVLDYLKKHNGAGLFNFFSFEWYPFDNICVPAAPQLAAAPGMLDIALKNIRPVLPAGMPIYLAEYGYSAYSGKSEVEITGALMYADILGKFLTMGGEKNFLYGYEPAYLEDEGCGYGNNMLLGLGDNGKISYRTAGFYGMKMLMHRWAVPGDSPLEIYPAAGDILNSRKQQLVTAYAIRRPGGQWSVALINKDPRKTFIVHIRIRNTLSKMNTVWYPSSSIQYSKKQYQWISRGEDSHPARDLPPVEKKMGNGSVITLPPYSLTVLNG